MSEAKFGFFDDEENEEKKEENIATKPVESSESNEQKKEEPIEEVSVQEDFDRYLSFSLNGQQFATPLLDVQEILELSKYKPLPNTMKYFLGVFNLRGQVVGLIDLRTKFGFTENNSTYMATLLIKSSSGLIAALVDEITQVISIPKNLIDPTPAIKPSFPQKYFNGIAKVEEEIISLIDLGKVISDDDLISMRQINKKAS